MAPELDPAEHLNPSKLGTKEYWEQAYDVETRNFTSDPTDEGQIWFSESDAEGRILSYLADEALPLTASFLDVGTGNGHLLLELLEEGGYEGAMIGIDYSPKAVALAQQIAEERNMAGRVKFYESDCMKDNLAAAEWVPCVDGEKGFDVVLDKGTFDAISLSDELLADGSGRRMYEGYTERIVGVMKKGGLLAVTSCNWTEEELENKLGTKDLELHGRIGYPSFSFGGKQGQAISTVWFRRK